MMTKCNILLGFLNKEHIIELFEDTLTFTHAFLKAFESAKCKKAHLLILHLTFNGGCDIEDSWLRAKFQNVACIKFLSKVRQYCLYFCMLGNIA
jgi:hypothetical protein